MREVFAAGVANTPFGKFHDRTLRDLAEEAVAGVLADAGAEPDAIDSIFFANAAAGLVTGQEMIRGQVALRRTGLLGTQIVNVENACASGATAFGLGVSAIASGAADVVLAIGAERLSHEDKAVSFSAFGGAVDQEELPPSDGAPQRSMFMDIYARMAREAMARQGATAADLAAVAVKSHRNAAHNPVAQFRDEVTVDEVLASRTVSDPLTLLMCSPIGDGAAAVLLASARGLERMDADPVRVLSSVLRSGTGRAEPSPIATAAQAAYREAGVGPDAIDLVELHDAAAPAELTVPEELGLVEAGGGGVGLLRSGASSLGGRLPLNPSGGLISKGHPIGATGCSQIVELVTQLRGGAGARQVEGARVALAENGGGWLGAGLAAVSISILAR
ncbi:thiolase family protein [Conexibacter arvalis]|uniref:propanoyl-CoA C-acyltransferase n=1 Tax=Conexibacter arvalis TaxID=912552 RepID=A0A840I8H5_9ACTN|nr:thiolase family protein [Conexibacter arvalis]MBB4660625.1 acetyl-CoA acetyltransferase [Conexibacter arvalis]